MDLRRFFRAPLLLIAVAVLLLLFVLDYANSGSSYQQVDTSQIVQDINAGQVKSALITDKNQKIQITTKSGKQLEASWVSGQGLQLANQLQQQVVKGTLPANGYNVSIPQSNALLSLIPTALIYLVIFLLFFFMLSQMQVDVAYTGFDIGDEFVVGYGLDYAQKYRNLPFIGTLAPAVYGGS